MIEPLKKIFDSNFAVQDYGVDFSMDWLFAAFYSESAAPFWSHTADASG
jgi:hypothetical protein